MSESPSGDMSLYTPPARVPSRLSVSAIRDFTKCAFYFKLGRIDKVPEERVTHHRWAGSVLHAAFQLAYATPEQVPGSFKHNWTVDNAGSLSDCLELFDQLWDGELIRTGFELIEGESRAQAAFTQLTAGGDLKPPLPHEFGYGTTKALKDKSHDARAQAWRACYRSMLEESLKAGLPYPVVAVEHEAHFEAGGVPMLGYIDIVMQSPEGLVYLDLKSGARLPSDKEITFDEQMNMYYTVEYAGQQPVSVWYSHMKTGTILEVPRNEPLIQAMREKAPQVMDQIARGIFTKRADSECGGCSRRMACMGV